MTVDILSKNMTVVARGCHTYLLYIAAGTEKSNESTGLHILRIKLNG